MAGETPDQPIVGSPESPKPRDLNTTVVSDTLTVTPPRLEADSPPDLSPRTLSTEPPSITRHEHLVFDRGDRSRQTRLLSTIDIGPSRILVLDTGAERPSDPASSRRNSFEGDLENSVPLFGQQFWTEESADSLYTATYELLEDLLETDENESAVSISVDMTAPSTALTLQFFVGVCVYVFEHPEDRSAIDLYYVPRTEADVRALFEGTDLSSDRTAQEESTTPAMEYLRRDLQDRYERLRESWNSLTRTEDLPKDLREEVTDVLDDVEQAIEGVHAEFGPQFVHRLEDAVWVLTDCMDDLPDAHVSADDDATPPHVGFQQAVEGLEAAVENLRTVVRDHRRAFSGSTRDGDTDTAGQSNGKSVERIVESLVESLAESDLQPLTDAVDEAGVIQIPIPSVPGSLGTQADDIQDAILRSLAEEGPSDSVSELARRVADRVGESYDDSFRSKVQYNTQKLVERGYVTQESAGRGSRTILSQMGQLWVEIHTH